MPNRQEELQLAKQWQEDQKKVKQERKDLQAAWREEERRKLTGDRISQVFKTFRFSSCSGCNDMTQILNHRGPDWALENIEWLLDEIEENAKKHPQLLARVAGKLQEKSQTVRDFFRKRLEAKIQEQKDDDELFQLLLP
jgi:hypothetical protein